MAMDESMSRKKKNIESSEPASAPLPFERQGFIKALNIALYITNFLLLHYVAERVSPGSGNIMRLGIIWFISYLLTRSIIELTKVPLRAGLAVAFGLILTFVLLIPKG